MASDLVLSRSLEHQFAIYGRLARLLGILGKAGDSSLAIAEWRLEKFLSELEKDLGGEAAQQKFREWNELSLNHHALFGVRMIHIHLEEWANPETAALIEAFLNAREKRFSAIQRTQSHNAKIERMEAEIKRLESAERAAEGEGSETKTALTSSHQRRQRAR